MTQRLLLLAVALVTPFAIAGRLVALVNTILVAATGVLTPLATTRSSPVTAIGPRFTRGPGLTS